MDFHHHFIKQSWNRELNELYLAMGLRSFAFSLISLFLPLYLYLELFSGRYSEIIGEQFVVIFRNISVNIIALKYTFFFFLVLSFGQFLAVYPAGKLVAKIGLKHSMLLTTPFSILFFVFLYGANSFLLNWFSLNTLLFMIFVVGFIDGATKMIFWIAFHLEFSKISDDGKRGKEISYLMVINSMLSVFGPIVGGLIITFSGFSTLLLLVVVLLMIFPLPLFSSKELHEPFSFSLKGIFNKQGLRQLLSFLACGIENGASVVLWPIILYFLLNNFSLLGVFTSVALFISLIFTIYIGKYADRHNKRDLIGLASIINSFVWMTKVIVVTPLQVFAIHSFGDLTKTTIEVPFNALVYERANNGSRMKYIMFREYSLIFGRSILYCTIIFVGNAFFGLVLVSIASLLYVFV